MPGKNPESLVDVFERALGPILARVCTSADGMAVAFSGGLDSSVLLRLASDYAHARNLSLFAFHIHHGLSPNADAWLAYCERQCAQLGVSFKGRRVEVKERGRHGTEQAARLARYAALGDLCRECHVPLLLTAHHQDDQAETVLLQLLRGSGVAGLAGMEACNIAPDLLGDARLTIGRPLLGTTRAQLEDVAVRDGIAYVDDESNADIRYARNAVRHDVLPALSLRFPGFQQRVSRAADHARSAQRLLDVLAEQDLVPCLCGDENSLDLERLGRLDMDRIDNLLRHWFALRGVRMPSTAWLAEMRKQLLAAKEDARIRVTHPDCEVRRYRNRMVITPRRAPLGTAPQVFRWSGEACLEFAAYRGTLHFIEAKEGEEGVDASWLVAQELALDVRRGSEMLRPAPNRPSRSLKHHYQALGIPEWERERLPVLRVGAQLLFAAGVGLNWRDLHCSADGVRFHWQPFPD